MAFLSCVLSYTQPPALPASTRRVSCDVVHTFAVGFPMPLSICYNTGFSLHLVISSAMHMVRVPLLFLVSFANVASCVSLHALAPPPGFLVRSILRSLCINRVTVPPMCFPVSYTLHPLCIYLLWVPKCLSCSIFLAFNMRIVQFTRVSHASPVHSAGVSLGFRFIFPFYFPMDFLMVPQVVPAIFAMPSLFVTPITPRLSRTFPHVLPRMFHTSPLSPFKFPVCSPVNSCVPQRAPDWGSSQYHSRTFVDPGVPSHIYFRSS